MCYFSWSIVGFNASIRIRVAILRLLCDISSFIGFAPATHARFVLVVTLDEPAPIRLEGGVTNYVGGKCSAPVFRDIAERTLAYLGEPPDDPHGYPRGDPRYDPEKADWIKEVKELKQLYDAWNQK